MLFEFLFIEEAKHRKNEKVVNIMAEIKVNSLDRYFIVISTLPVCGMAGIPSKTVILQHFGNLSQLIQVTSHSPSLKTRG